MSQFFLTDHQKHQLQEQLKRTRDAHVYRRTLALLAVDQGEPIAQTTRLLQIGRRTLYDWIERYQDCQSPKALLHQPGQGRPTLWTKRDVATLNSVLRKSPQDLGYPASGWTTSLLQEYLFHKSGLIVSENTLRRQLHHLGYGWKRFRYVLMADPDREKKKADSAPNRHAANPQRCFGRGRNRSSPLSTSFFGMGAKRFSSAGPDFRQQCQAGGFWNHQFAYRLSAVSGQGTPQRSGLPIASSPSS